MLETTATKAIKLITSALRASARRNPWSAVTCPLSATWTAATAANTATAAKAKRFSLSHVVRDRVVRQSNPAKKGRNGRRRRVMAWLSLLASDDVGSFVQQLL